MYNLKIKYQIQFSILRKRKFLDKSLYTIKNSLNGIKIPFTVTLFQDSLREKKDHRRLKLIRLIISVVTRGASYRLYLEPWLRGRGRVGNWWGKRGARRAAGKEYHRVSAISVFSSVRVRRAAGSCLCFACNFRLIDVRYIFAAYVDTSSTSHSVFASSCIQNAVTGSDFGNVSSLHQFVASRTILASFWVWSVWFLVENDYSIRMKFHGVDIDCTVLRSYI